MGKGEWVKGEANGLRPVVIEKEMGLRDAAACWPPRPAADGSRVCRCCSSSCSLHGLAHGTKVTNGNFRLFHLFLSLVGGKS